MAIVAVFLVIAAYLIFGPPTASALGSRPGKRVMMKTNWKDALPLRRPNGQWQVGHAARFFEKVLGIPAGCVVIKRPDGQPTMPTDTVGSLRVKIKG